MALCFEDIVRKLADNNIESPRLEARLIVAEAKKIDGNAVSSLIEISAEDAEKIDDMLKQRLQHKPLDKIFGHREFYKYDFLCDENVLSPRPDTEILVECAADLIFKHKMQNVLELGVGSGCVLLSLLADFPFLSGSGIDISDKALKVAAKNAERLGVQNRANLFCADWNEKSFGSRFVQPFDMVVSNPPYIPSEQIFSLEPEVKDHDPLCALDGGNSGFDGYCRIAKTAPFLLKNGGYLLFESGYGQAQKIADICLCEGFELIDIKKDLAGIERCVIVKKKLAK